MEALLEYLREAADAVKPLPADLRPLAFQFLLQRSGRRTALRRRGVKSVPAETTGQSKARRKGSTPKILDVKLKKPDVTRFVRKKNPRNHEEKYVVAAYFLKEKAGVTAVGRDHVYTFYRLAGWKTPKALDQVFRDAKARQDWFGERDAEGNWPLTHIGESFVLHDLPRQSDEEGETDD
jgi:hypothetical protein